MKIFRKDKQHLQLKAITQQSKVYHRKMVKCSHITQQPHHYWMDFRMPVWYLWMKFSVEFWKQCSICFSSLSNNCKVRKENKHVNNIHQKTFLWYYFTYSNRQFWSLKRILSLRTKEPGNECHFGSMNLINLCNLSDIYKIWTILSCKLIVYVKIS